MKEFVIIGNGTAATNCIEGIRSIDTESNITVVSEENHPAYCRPLISYLLQGKTDTEKIMYRDPDFYDRNNCKVIYGVKATSIDPESKSVSLDNGDVLTYDSLCVAAGSSPTIIPFEGLDSVENVFSFTTLDQALALDDAVSKSSKVLIMGGGLIGIKCAEAIADKAGEIIICDLAGRVLSSILQEDMSKIVEDYIKDFNINFVADSVSSFKGNTAIMSSGAEIDFDILVFALGVRANTALIKDCGGEVGRGIVVNSKSETSIPDIYAAGDCTETIDVTTGVQKIMALMPNAAMQGKCAGKNMAGGDEVFDQAMPMNSMGIFDMHMMSAGSYEGDSYVVSDEKSCRKIFTDGDKIKGFILLDDLDRAGIYTACVRESRDLSDADIESLKRQAGLASFSSQYRAKVLGGEV